jgi:hypothetical protein
MVDTAKSTTRGDGCDIRIWSGECAHSSFSELGEKYMCTICEKIKVLDHEVRHDVFPYVSGDYDMLM